MKNLLQLTFAILLVIQVSCKQSGQKAEQQEESSGEEANLGFGADDLDEMYHRFPSPEEMMSILDKDDIEFKDDILNDPKKSRQYLNSRAQGLNLGVYSADLAYLTLFERHKESPSYFEAIYNLSTELRISSAFDLELLRRVQSNLTSPDSLKSLSEFAFNKISNYLESNNKEKVFALISIGGFVEALYLSFIFTGEFSAENVIVQRIADQKLVLENIVGYSRPFMGDPALKGALEAMQPILSVYNKIVAVPAETTVSKTEDGKIIISGGSRITLTQLQYDELKEATMLVRKQITQN